MGNQINQQQASSKGGLCVYGDQVYNPGFVYTSGNTKVECILNSDGNAMWKQKVEPFYSDDYEHYEEREEYRNKYRRGNSNCKMVWLVLIIMAIIAYLIYNNKIVI